MTRNATYAGTLLLGVLLLAPLQHALGAELQPGQQYAPGSRVESSSAGISFALPREWLGGLPAQGAAFVLGSNTRAGIGLVIMRQAASWQDVQSFLNQPQDMGDGVILMPVSAGQMTERGYEIELGNQMYRGHAIGRVGDSGNGVVVFFGGPSADIEYYRGLTGTTASSVQFSAPQQSGEQMQWQNLLAGMMLRRMSSYYSGGLDGAYVGGSSSETLHLCSNGTYAYFSSSNVAADGGGGTSGYSGDTGGSQGQWSLETMGAQTVLTLRAANGEFSQHAMQYAEGNTYLDGERVYRVQSDRCQ